jgi:hypothetical protein
MHVEHCKECGRCVKHFHMHSKYYNKCFGENNIRSYVVFLLLQLALSVLFVYSLAMRGWPKTKSSSSTIKFVEMHVFAPNGWIDTAGLVFTEFMGLNLLMSLMQALSAICRGMTINEMENCWNYKYLY